MKRREIVQEQPQERSEAEVRDDVLRSWAQDSRCQEAFMPMLTERLQELQDRMPALADKPGSMAVVVGGHDELKSLYKKFLGYLEE
jgi:hypothetical protein